MTDTADTISTEPDDDELPTAAPGPTEQEQAEAALRRELAAISALVEAVQEFRPIDRGKAGDLLELALDQLRHLDTATRERVTAYVVQRAKADAEPAIAAARRRAAASS